MGPSELRSKAFLRSASVQAAAGEPSSLSLQDRRLDGSLSFSRVQQQGDRWAKPEGVGSAADDWRSGGWDLWVCLGSEQTASPGKHPG